MIARASTLLLNGSIYTMDPQLSTASAVAVADGVITAVGGSELSGLATPETRIIDLAGRCVLPGLTDSHIHLRWFALSLQRVDLTGARSLAAMLELVAERARVTPPGGWVLGQRWDQELWPDRRFPCAADIDRLVPDHPVALTAKSGHALVANSLALQLAGVTANTPDPEGAHIARDSSGNPTGLLFEKAAMDLVKNATPQPEPDALAVAMRPAFERAWQVGVTAVHDMDELSAFDAFQRLRARGELGLRVVKYLPIEALDHAEAIALRSGLGDDWLRVGGIKVFADGALGARTAAMLEPYVGEPDNRGIMTTRPEVLAEIAQRATEGGLALAIHALGDRAIRVVLDAIAAAQGAGPQQRHRIEHVQHLHPDDVGRLAELGVVGAMQPIHVVQDAPMVDRYLGERGRTAYAWRSLLDAGTVLAFGSDFPVEDVNPFLGIEAAVTRVCVNDRGGSEAWHPEQRLTVEEAVRAYTRGAAYAAGLEDRLGSLTPGKLADLVVLDRDVFTCDPVSIGETKVLGTMLGGKWVFGTWAAN
jgi:predicted amidohydrolase YtcJ